MNKEQAKKAVFIVDGSSFLYRAFYSMPPFTTREGISVGAVYGFCRMIKKLMDTYTPANIVLVWDSKGKTVRHEIYPEYKANREAMPSDLAIQKEYIQEFAHLIGLRQLMEAGIEADDLMFSLAESLKSEGQPSVLVTSDKDLRQAIDGYINVLDPFKYEFVTREAVEAKLGLPLTKYPFYFSLIGDASDNIPGVKGVGPKTAQKIVNQFDSLEDMYQNLDEVSSDRIRGLLAEYKEKAFLSMELFKLRVYDISLTTNCCYFDPAGWQNALPLFQRFEFKSLLKDMGAPLVEQDREPLSKKYSFKSITTKVELSELCEKIKLHRKCALDTETTGLDPFKDELIGISFCVQEGAAYYIPIGHRTTEQQLDRGYVLAELKPILEDESIEKYLHHAKFDMLVLYNSGIMLEGLAFDTIIAASLLVGDGQRKGLKALSDYYFQEPMLMFEDIVKKNKYPDFSYVPVSLAAEYAAADAHQTLKLHRIFEKEIHEKNLQDIFHKIEMPLVRVLFNMEILGISMDPNVLHEIDLVVSKEISKLHTQIIDLIGQGYWHINLNSPKQLEELLFVHLKLPVLKKTAQRTSYSTDQEVLKELSKVHPVPGLVMHYRELYKLKSTYLDSLGNYLNPKTNRIHTTFSQTIVPTGRLSSSDPNLQNIPVDRFAVRSAFKAKPGRVFLAVDYSQIELRVLGYLSQDETLVKAFSENKDIHALTAAGLFDVGVSCVTGEQRQVGKRINFSILYGLTPYGLAKDLGISHGLAKSYIEKFMAQYPGVCNWMELVVCETKEKGYVETLHKRRRYLPGIHEKNKTMFDLARRIAINTAAQGTAAEIVKLGMLNLEKALIANNLGAKMLLQIHDELILEVPESEVSLTEKLVSDILQNVASWNVPLVVSSKIGRDWQEVTK